MSHFEICKFCNSKFKSISSLNHHQKTAKYCLQNQTENQTIKKKSIDFECQYCNKKLSNKHSLNRHLEVCKSQFKNKDREIKELKDEFKEQFEKQKK